MQHIVSLSWAAGTADDPGLAAEVGEGVSARLGAHSHASGLPRRRNPSGASCRRCPGSRICVWSADNDRLLAQHRFVLGSPAGCPNLSRVWASPARLRGRVGDPVSTNSWGGLGGAWAKSIKFGPMLAKSYQDSNDVRQSRPNLSDLGRPGPGRSHMAQGQPICGDEMRHAPERHARPLQGPPSRKAWPARPRSRLRLLQRRRRPRPRGPRTRARAWGPSEAEPAVSTRRSRRGAPETLGLGRPPQREFCIPG